jgi:sporulation protein YlmC with PRC-barrel domain
MLIELKKLFHLPVFTVSGQKLGVVLNGEIDIETHLIRAYTVGNKVLGKEKYYITPVQIKMITAEKMLVEDGLSPFNDSLHFKTKTTTPQMAMTIIEEK